MFIALRDTQFRIDFLDSNVCILLLINQKNQTYK